MNSNDCHRNDCRAVLIFALIMLRKVHQIYRATGATFAKAMTEGQSSIGTTLWSNETVRNATQQAAQNAAQHAAQVHLHVPN